MDKTKTEQLKNLLNKVLADDQGDVIGYLDDFLTTDNNAAVLIEILEAAEKVKKWLPNIGYGVAAKYSEHVQAANKLREALRKWNGGG